ncbi:A/G-specific adenine glycosylase [Cochleicola gelatinilyticus]|uniref:Adenine DNA glycosylase n=1 Tax=Cochleicola gelatinilyticus TaxID=1763537 RepID=A0A167IU66_9FLAO|nr:A/G-specific adenine glycosylase [Cochleicola gelatinilyticus]OAB80018.1 A/G-specific adenine glycosylase [Cochleicola gelatinilyticus]
MNENAPFFSNKLISWYLENKRELPWRGTKDPYFIWLSEIMLQQTRVAQGMPYYFKFTETFPTVFDLAAASEAEVLKLWQGLGYYSRARNLHTTAKYIAYELNGRFPSTYKDLVALKGVGDYTASAIASICFSLPHAVVDGNVYRVLARVFGITTPINVSKGIKDFKVLAQKLLEESNPGTYNQAIMEFGARFCVPQNPECSRCIFKDECVAYNNGSVKEIPVKLKKVKVKKRFFNYLVFLSPDNTTQLIQRTQKGIWQQLYEFPLVETEKEVSLDVLKKETGFKTLVAGIQLQSVVLYKEDSVIHKLSHQHLYTRFWIVSVSEVKKNRVPISEIRDYPVPVLIQNFISEFSAFTN